MYDALCEFLKGNDVIYYCRRYDDAKWLWLQIMNSLHEHKIIFCAKQSDLTIKINGYTMKLAHREDQMAGCSNVHIFDEYGYDYYQQEQI